MAREVIAKSGEQFRRMYNKAITKALIEADPRVLLEAAGLAWESDEMLIEVQRDVLFAPLKGAAFDPGSTIDLLLRTSHRAVPIVVKTGCNRMGKTRFSSNFLSVCERSSDKLPRWNGNAIGILERRFPDLSHGEVPTLETELDGAVIPLTNYWIFVTSTPFKRLEKRNDLFVHARIVRMVELMNKTTGLKEPLNLLLAKLLIAESQGSIRKQE